MQVPADSSAFLRDATPVLVLGKGITTLATIRCLARVGIPVYVAGATDDLVRRSRWFRPLPGRRTAEIPNGDLAAELSSVSFERLVLLATSDRWVTAVSRLPGELSARFPSRVPPPAVLDVLVDKGRFAAELERTEVPHPRTRLLRGPQALASVPAQELSGAFLKPTQSGPFAAVYGAKALRFADPAAAARVYEDATGRGFEMMLQEFIPGPATRHCFVEGYIDRAGRLCGLLARRRLRMFPTDFGNSTATQTVAVADVAPAADAVLRLLRHIDYRGIFSAEFKLDERDGLYKILEVNARPWWFVGFAASCGVNVCSMAYRDALGEPVEVVTGYDVGRRCVAGRLDLEAGLAGRRAGGSGLAGLLSSWVGASQLTLHLDDPKPGLWELGGWIRSRVRRKLGW